MPCQDAFGVRVVGPHSLVVAVCDGLGSARLSADGSRIAAEAAAHAGGNWLTRGLDPGSVTRLMAAAARAALERAAGDDLRDYATTLIAVAVDGSDVAVAHCGDGAVVCASRGRFLLASGPGPSEYVDEVDPITSSRWRTSLRCSGLGCSLDGVAVLTDGCQRAALAPGGRPHAGFFEPLFRFVGAAPPDADEQLTGLLAGRKLSEHSDDDKTLVLAVT